ncbi:hypothetical protein [Actinoallomurus sp. NPDC052274]
MTDTGFIDIIGARQNKRRSGSASTGSSIVSATGSATARFLREHVGGR